MAGREQIGRHCPYCGAIITYDEFFCRACHKRLEDQQDLTVPSVAGRAETYVVSVRNPFLAAILAIISPGLGQFYNGETLKGICIFLAFMAVSFDIVTVPYRQAIFFGIWVVGIVDSLSSARQINRFGRSFTRASYLLYMELALLAFVAALHIMTGLPDIGYMGRLFPPVALWEFWPL
jgi:TM2 domain-containing membrane protein YozV